MTPDTLCLLPDTLYPLPAHFDVRIVDERLKKISGQEPVDIVFITTLTFNAYRAYALARVFRARGIPVVLGGIHATVCPEEAAAHATSVVIGEAEGVVTRNGSAVTQRSAGPCL